MSAGYAERLSAYPHKGVVGLPESFDSARSLTVKINRLVDLIMTSPRWVVLTGAGISTPAGIHDFRGPTGIWTQEQQEKKTKTKKKGRKRKRPPPPATTIEGSNEDGVDEDETGVNDTDCGTLGSKSSSSSTTSGTSTQSMTITTKALTCLSQARPTLTHRAITWLAHNNNNKGKKGQQQQPHQLYYCITQNVDGLHRRSGLSRRYHSSVHGCVFTEKCYECGTEYFGDVDTGGLSFQPTGRTCRQKDCGGTLHDVLLDWEDSVLDMDRVESECEKADLVLCLGTSLRIEPVGSLPLKARRFVIVNLQATPHDEAATLVIRARVDDVMDRLMVQLGHVHWKDDPDPPVERQWTPPPSDADDIEAFREVVRDADERRRRRRSAQD